MAQPQKIYIPTFISSIDYKPARVLPHVYFWNGTKATNTYFVQSYASGSKNALTASALQEFPYFDNIFLQNDTGSQTLLFNNELPVYGTAPSQSLYSEYWSKYVELLYNPVTRLINATAIIPLADYFKMELNDVVEFRGNYYHLRSIADYNLSNGECSLELLGPLLSDTVSELFGGSCLFDFTSVAVVPTTTTTSTSTTSTTSTSTTSTSTSTSTTSTTSTTLPPTTSTTSTTTVAPYSVEYLLVAGGGGGGFGGGGGGGGGAFKSGSYSVSSAFVYPVVIGAGGAGSVTNGDDGDNGSNSTVFSLTSNGGGGGGTENRSGLTGGNGGGAGYEALAGVGNQGFNGGNGVLYGSGGGGGSSAVGSIGQFRQSGTGGGAKQWTPNVTYYAGGGGGGDVNGTGGPGGGGGFGDRGGGGNGGTDQAGQYGTTNTGGGAGGGSNEGVGFRGGNGGSGIVIIRYAGTPRGTGGTITQSGGYTTHTFTASGTFTG